MSFQDRLKSLRLARNLTQKQVADATGMAQMAYQRYEYGTREPAFHNLIALADYFDVPLDYLAGTGPFAQWEDLMRHRDAFVYALAGIAPGIPWAGLPEADLIALCGAILSRAEVEAETQRINLYPRLSLETLERFGVE